MDSTILNNNHRAGDRRWIGWATLCVWLIPAMAISADAPTLSPKRTSWTSEELYDDFLAEFGQGVEACFSNYRLHGAPPLPGTPKVLGKPWSSAAVVAIDASGSMQRHLDGTRKIMMAKTAVRQFVRSAPRGAQVGVLAFGHQGNNNESEKALSCAGIEMLSGPTPATRKPLSKVLDSLQAKGWTPLAGAIMAAGQSLDSLAKDGQPPIVLVVSDGLETCGGDPVAAAKTVHESESETIVNIIGFDVSLPERDVLAKVAQAGGGVFVHAANEHELAAHLRVTYVDRDGAQAYDAAALKIKKENTSQAMGAANHATTCVQDIVHHESDQFLAVTQSMVNAGQIDAATALEAHGFLKGWHEELETEMHAFVDQARAELERINNRIDRDRRRVMSAYTDLP
ncbi:hypothetical protein GCM10027565_02470 [Bordetella tumulicola]